MRYNRRYSGRSRSIVPYGVRRLFTMKNLLLGGAAFAAYHFRDKLKDMLTKLKG